MRITTVFNPTPVGRNVTVKQIPSGLFTATGVGAHRCDRSLFLKTPEGIFSLSDLGEKGVVGYVRSWPSKQQKYGADSTPYSDLPIISYRSVEAVEFAITLGR